jgi:hypothetical protein
MLAISAFIITYPVYLLLLLLIINIIIGVQLEFPFVQKHSASSFRGHLGAQLS